MTKVPLAEVKDALSDYVKKAAHEEILITKDGKPAAILIGFANEDDWLDYRLENDERFLKRIAQSRDQARTGRFIRLEDIDKKP